MKRSRMFSGSLAPAVFTLTLIFFIISVVLTDAAAARDKKSPEAGVRRESSAQKTPDRKREPGLRDRPKDRTPDHISRPASEKNVRPAETRDRTRDRKPPATGSTYKRKPPGKIDRNPPPSGRRGTQPDRRRDDDGITIRRPPREKVPYNKEKKTHGRPGRPFKPGKVGGNPWIPPRRIPPRPHHIHYHDTYITNIYNIHVINPVSYMYYPICLPGLTDGGLYEIGLPFGPILPWEIGEFYLIRLKNLEKNGFGGSMIVTIIQTRDEMGWEEFLYRFEDRITDVRYYGPVGRTAFLVGMTVSDILDLMVDEEIRWAGEFYPDYKIVPGGRNTKFYVRSLEGDSIEFRRELRDAGVFVMRYDPGTGEYYVRSSQDNYGRVASLWWVARVSGISGEPFFLPEEEWIDVGMAP